MSAGQENRRLSSGSSHLLKKSHILYFLFGSDREGHRAVNVTLLGTVVDLKVMFLFFTAQYIYLSMPLFFQLSVVMYSEVCDHEQE